jgi:ABC-2 type transport system permease protein
MKLLRLFAASFSLSLRVSLAHRVNLAFDVAQSLTTVAAVLITILVVYQHTSVLAGWSRPQILVLTGVYALISGIRGAFIDPSLSKFAGTIRDGTLDDALLRPAPSWFTTTCREHAPAALGQSVVGIGVIVAGMRSLPYQPKALNIATAAVLTGGAVVITWSLSLIFASLAFWADRVELAPLTASLWDVGRYPADAYRQPLRVVVGGLIPVAGMITLPSAVLTGNDPLVSRLIAGLALTAGFVAVAMLVFRRGLKRYTGATS